MFSGVKGKPLLPVAVTRFWTELTQRARASGARLHGLHHFHATMLLMRDVHRRVVQERLNRFMINITLCLYRTSFRGPQLEAKDLF